jgi:cyanuric acid amidohydrolase
MTRRAIVHRISASAPDDVSGIEAAIASQRIDPKGVIAVLAKTEGNGLVNDFSRGHASLALSLLFERHLATDEAARVCLVMSGGTEGAMAPHWLVFERAGGDGTEGPVARDWSRHHSTAAIRASRPAAPGRSSGRSRARGHARRRHR